MAVITQQYIDAIHQYEGGLSADPKDTAAAAHPSPCGKDSKGNPYHTNKGVTYSTFKSLAPTLGYTADCATFLAMPDDVWIKIFKHGYWNPIQLDGVKSNGVAYLLADFSWGSGAGYVPPFLKKFLSTNYNIIASDTTSQIKALNNLTAKDEQGVIQKISDARLSSLKTMKDKKGNSLFATYGTGWTNRLNGLTDLATSMVGKIKSELKQDLSSGAYNAVAKTYRFTKQHWIGISLIGVAVTGITVAAVIYFSKVKK